ncbi:hypothetical protein [Flavobacteriaceae bacterium 14752]|uniref:hypothetical protein n=1 Tax=Mesohalobacter salilacus TaxID=2491711 RepID=UPI000F6359DF|nr:hypothetical protein EIG84_05790 [Flavobacteriaceae bacterium 14752]
MKKAITILILFSFLSCKSYDYLYTKEVNLPKRVELLFKEINYTPCNQKEALDKLLSFTENNVYVFFEYQKTYPKWVQAYFELNNNELHHISPKQVYESFNEKLKHDINYLTYK